MAEKNVVIDGKYEILKKVGEGGMSTVYLAIDTRLNKQWAIKEIKKIDDSKRDEIVINSLLAEANLIKRLDHPALPRIVDIIDNEITIFIVMDYIEGESLDKILNEYGAQSEDIVIGWAKQLCDVLSYLHEQKPPIIYRDMKPANIMIKPEGNVKIIDFGIAREYNEQSLADTTVLGTRGYAPPEQYSGQTDTRSDIYALGMTLHHVLTGIDPRASEGYAPVRMWNPEISEGMESIIDKCVQPAAEYRYQNCQDLLYDLEHPELITRDYKRKQKRKVHLFTAACVVFGFCLLVGIICNVCAMRLNTGSYDMLVATSTASSLEDKILNYKSAIDIYPQKPDAYYKILEAYEDEGEFGKKENDVFLAIYNINQDMLNPKDVGVLELRYKIGMMYFNYYTEENHYSFSTRVQKAYTFFEENHQSNREFPHQEISDCYYQICGFYKKYILNTTTIEEVSKENYDNLIKKINSTIGSMNKSSPYDQLMLYNSVLMLLYDQRNSMTQVDVEEEDVVTLLETVYKKTRNLTVQKEQSKQLQNEILENYEEYMEAIKRSYINAKQRQ